MAKDKQPAKQKDITELIKKQNAFKEDLSKIDILVELLFQNYPPRF